MPVTTIFGRGMEESQTFASVQRRRLRPHAVKFSRVCEAVSIVNFIGKAQRSSNNAYSDLTSRVRARIKTMFGVFSLLISLGGFFAVHTQLLQVFATL